MKLRFLSGVIVGCLLSLKPAIAQETGTLITRKAAQIDSRDKNAARKTLEIFAKCVVDRQAGRASKIIDFRVDVPEYEKYMGGLTDYYDECLSSGEFAFSYATFRGAMFEALYLRKFKSDGPLTFDPSLQSGYRALYPETLTPEAQDSVAQVNFGECVVRADAQGVRNLLTSQPGSATETEAVMRIGQKLSACIVKGSKISFSKSVLRGMLAEGLYRLSMASERASEARK